MTAPPQILVDDRALLLQFTQEGSESAFRELVNRYVAMVYGVCQRRLADPHLAEDVTQAVFVVLARRAKDIAPHIVMAAWLHKTAVYCCSNAQNLKKTRNYYEKRVIPMTPPTNHQETVEFSEIEELLDEGILTLTKTEREAVVLRYFQDKTLPEISRALQLTSYATEKNLEKGLARLRKFLAKRGVTISLAALSVGLAAQSSRAALALPSALAATATSAALSSQAAALTGTVGAIVSAALRTAAMAKLKMALIAASLVLFCTTMGVAFGMSWNGAGHGNHLLAAQAEKRLASVPSDADLAELHALLHRAAEALRTADNQTLLTCCSMEDPQQRDRWEKMVGVFQASYHLTESLQSHFPADFATFPTIPTLGSHMDTLLSRIDFNATQWELTDSNHALVRFHFTANPTPMPSGSLYFLRTDGHWQIDVPDSINITLAAAEPTGDVLPFEQLPLETQSGAVEKLHQLASRMNTLTAQISSGQVADIAEVKLQLNTLSEPTSPALALPRVFYQLELRYNDHDKDRPEKVELSSK